jgi:hypothetical protein
MKYPSYYLVAAALLVTWPSVASAHYCHRHQAVVIERPTYYQPHHRQWNPVGAIMAVPRAALRVPMEALSVPERVLGVDDDE